MTDRRRTNGPNGGTTSAIFTATADAIARPHRVRKDSELRSIFLQTGIIPAASGSAYLELKPDIVAARTFMPIRSTLKLSCSVHGPKPLARNASFSPNLQLNASIKFAPFATHRRRGYVRDGVERDLGSHLENALKGVIIPDRYPKSSIDIAVIVLEGEEDCLWSQEYALQSGIGGVGLMNVLAGSVTVAGAALADAGIDCLDLVSGGVAASVATKDGDALDVLDPCPSEHEEIASACVVALLPSRDELTEVWSKGSQPNTVVGIEQQELLLNRAVAAARASHTILSEVVKESMAAKGTAKIASTDSIQDVEMTT